MRDYIRDGRAPIPEDETRSRIMSAIRGKDTKPELAVRTALREIGLPGYRLHWKKAPGRPDIVYPGRRIAIFVHGCYWHRCPHCNPSLPKTHTDFWEKKFQRNVERDARKQKVLSEEGWKVFVFWGCQIKDDVFALVEKVKAYIEENQR